MRYTFVHLNNFLLAAYMQTIAIGDVFPGSVSAFQIPPAPGDVAKILRHALQFDVNQQLRECESQLKRSYARLTDVQYHPVDIPAGQSTWRLVKNNMADWVQGFYPGTLWYMYEATGKPQWKTAAQKTTEALDSFKYNTQHHDIGFVMYCSFGNGYRLTKDENYKQVLLQSAASALKRFNPVTGTIQSWNIRGNTRWRQHPTIIDNMMNLELLFWAAQNGGGEKCYEVAVKHATTTMQHHFRPDYSSYHVLDYDTLTGQPIRKLTAQGYSDSSMWARGQAWAIYGFTMTYRATKNPAFLTFVEHVADRFIRDLPKDGIPYWDFNAPNIPYEERDAAAGAIAASALLELQQYVPDMKKKKHYLQTAARILNTLSSDHYFAKGKADAFLLHSVGSKPAHSQVDVSLSYADYYYLEGLIRLKKLLNRKNFI